MALKMFIMFVPRSLATRMHIAVLFTVVENVETRLMGKNWKKSLRKCNTLVLWNAVWPFDNVVEL